MVIRIILKHFLSHLAATLTTMTINREIKDAAFARKRDISPGIVLKKARRVMVMEKRKVVLSAAVITWRLIANNRMCVAR